MLKIKEEKAFASAVATFSYMARASASAVTLGRTAAGAVVLTRASAPAVTLGRTAAGAIVLPGASASAVILTGIVVAAAVKAEKIVKHIKNPRISLV